VQKPGRKAFEQCPREVQNWLENEYPLIKRQAKAENAEKQWCNEMGVRSDAASARFFRPKVKRRSCWAPARDSVAT